MSFWNNAKFISVTIIFSFLTTPNAVQGNEFVPFPYLRPSNDIIVSIDFVAGHKTRLENLIFKKMRN